MYILYINCIYATIPDYMLYMGMYICYMHAYFRVRACIHLTHFCYAILVYTIKCHINIVLNWFTFLMVQSMEIVSEEHAEKLFILIILCKYRDHVVLRNEGTNARLTLCPQPKRRCTVSRAPQARAKKFCGFRT